MRIVLAFALITLAAIPAAAGTGQEEFVDMVAYRANYANAMFADKAVRDFEEVEKRIGDLVERLQREGEVSESGGEELMLFVQQLEREYIERWYGPPDNLKYGRYNHSQVIRGTQSNAGYDSTYREQTRPGYNSSGKLVTEPPQDN